MMKFYQISVSFGSFSGGYGQQVLAAEGWRPETHDAVEFETLPAAIAAAEAGMEEILANDWYPGKRQVVVIEHREDGADTVWSSNEF